MSSTASPRPMLRLADQGFFWVGVERKRVPAGMATYGPMYVSYQWPAETSRPYPVVLVHGGGGQGLAYHGRGSGSPGWAHYLLDEGYAVYIVDRPGHGRAPYHPDVLGPMAAPMAYESGVPMFSVGARGGRWPGSGQADDPGVGQFMAQQGPTIADRETAERLWRSRGAELLERIGPSIVVTHSAGGPFGWLVADARPDLVKAIVSVEGAGPQSLTTPLTGDPPAAGAHDLPAAAVTPADGGPSHALQATPARPLANVSRVPIMLLTADDPGFQARTDATAAYLRQGGCGVDDVRLAGRGITGNGHFMLLEDNNREVLQVILDWLGATVEQARAPARDGAAGADGRGGSFHGKGQGS